VYFNWNFLCVIDFFLGLCVVLLLFIPLVCLSPLVWFFLWLPEEVLALLFLLHRENGDFSILMKDILLLFVLVFHLSISPLSATAVMWLLISLMTE